MSESIRKAAKVYVYEKYALRGPEFKLGILQAIEYGYSLRSEQLEKRVKELNEFLLKMFNEVQTAEEMRVRIGSKLSETHYIGD